MRDRYGIKGQNWAASAFASVFGRSARITSARPLTRRRLETFRSRGPDTEQRLAMHAVPVQANDIADAGGVRGGCGMDRADGLCWDR
jgi:hypothetical protein